MLGSNCIPDKITIDKSGSNKVALDHINFIFLLAYIFGYAFYNIQIRQIKYLNNIAPQDNRGIKKIIKPMMGFKAEHSATATFSGIELWRMLKKDQHQQAANMSIFEQFYTLAG